MGKLQKREHVGNEGHTVERLSQ